MAVINRFLVPNTYRLERYWNQSGGQVVVLPPDEMVRKNWREHFADDIPCRMIGAPPNVTEIVLLHNRRWASSCLAIRNHLYLALHAEK